MNKIPSPSLTFKNVPSSIGAILALFIMLFGGHLAMGQLVNNRGALIAIKPGATVIVKTGSVANDTGYIRNESSLIIEGSLINNDTVTGGQTASFFEIQGDWINNATFIPDQSTVTLTGTDQTIGGDVVTTFYNLILSGTGVKNQEVDAAVSNTLDLSNLELATDTNTMLVTNTSVNAIQRTAGFVSSLGNGRLTRVMNSTGPYLFPTGSSLGTNRYRPIEVRQDFPFNQTIAVRFANTDATLEGFDRSTRENAICSINPLYFHMIDRLQGMDPVDVSFFYNPLEDAEWTGIAQWRNVPRWESTGPAINNPDTVFNELTLQDWTNFSGSPYALMLSKPLIDTSQTLIQDVSCNGGSDGSICIATPPISGTPPFSYQWSTGEMTPCISGLAAGIYGLTVRDSFNCPSVYSFTVGQPIPISVAQTVTDASCKGASDGQICISITGDWPPFEYEWSLPGDSSCLTGLGAGSYGLTVTDANGCTRTSPISVGEPDLLVVTAHGEDVTCFGLDDGRAFADVEGGTVPYDFLWNITGDTTFDTEGLEADFYRVTVTDAHGCTAVSGVQVNEPDQLIIETNGDQTIARGFSTELNVISQSGGTGTIDYQWSPDYNLTNPTSSTTTARPDTTTTYIITAIDENGCLDADTITVTVDVNLYTFPDGFVPAGANNVFAPITSSTVEVLELKIFNRWGQLVSDDPTGWDGRFEGEIQPMDTYVYQTVILLPDGTKTTETGDFILIW